MVALTPPGRTAHTFNFTPVNLLQSYAPPTIPGSPTDPQFTYNVDRRLTQMMRADTVVTLAYDAAGRLQSVTSPQETVQATYDAASRLNTLATASGIGLTYSHDGSLLTATSWSGPVTGTVQRTFDNNRRLTGRTINGANSQTFTYDADGLLSQAGALTLQRSAQNGLLTATALGLVSDTRSFNGFAEWTSYSATAGATSLFSAQYTRDQAGRVTQLVETMAGVSATVTYNYDLVGRLTEVKKNGVTTSTYTYDANGNRLTHTTAGGEAVGSYDAQDRLTQYGATTFMYTPNGDLLSATAGGQTTSYGYDVPGNLRSVTLPGGTQIEYLIDGRNRRIGKKVNGTSVQAFLYQSRLQPIAELDGNNTVISTFVYGSRPNVPDYIVKGGATYRIIADQLGSPRLVVDTATGAIAQQLDYDEFGKVRLDTNPGFQPFGFAGGLYDRDTQLVRFGARDYDPDAGRWTSKDTSGLAGGINLYGYAYNDPVNWIDATGNNAAAAGTLIVGGTALSGPLGIAAGVGIGGVILAGGIYASVVVLPELIDTFGNIVEENADPTHDDEGKEEGGAPPQEDGDGGTCPNTPVVPQGETDKSPPPDEAIPDDFLTNPTFPRPGPTPRIPYPETPEDGFPYGPRGPLIPPGFFP